MQSEEDALWQRERQKRGGRTVGRGKKLQFFKKHLKSYPIQKESE